MKLLEKDSFFMRFYGRHPILSHLGLMLVVSIFLALLAMLFLNIWTLHGRTTKVPDVKGLSFEAASRALDEAGLNVELYDSLYDDTLRLGSGQLLRHVPGGTVLKTIPPVGSEVKPGRMIYVSVRAFNPEKIVIHSPLNVSLKQVEDDLMALGLTRISVQYVPSEYDDLVTRVTADGRTIVPGSTVPKNARIVLYVGRTSLLHDEIDQAIESGVEFPEDEPLTEPETAAPSEPDVFD